VRQSRKYAPHGAFLWWKREAICDAERGFFERQRAAYYPALVSAVAKFPAARLIQTTDVFCDKEFCHMARDHVLFFRDPNHLTIAGSKFLADGIIDQFKDLTHASSETGSLLLPLARVDGG
jgi:hypothetical protein